MPPESINASPRLSVGDLLEEARRGLRRVEPGRVPAAVAAGAVLVDIRSEGQRAAEGLIPGAVHVARNVLEWRADPGSGHPEPALGDVETRLILICQEGYQSSLAAATLQRLGRDATDIVGGFVAWRADGLPVVSSAVRRGSTGRPDAPTPEPYGVDGRGAASGL
jgi:rhodanese-related sulfurtransferase